MHVNAEAAGENLPCFCESGPHVNFSEWSCGHELPSLWHLSHDIVHDCVFVLPLQLPVA